MMGMGMLDPPAIDSDLAARQILKGKVTTPKDKVMLGFLIPVVFGLS
jgi:hypothetical protein